jgi:hypothetical protein
VPAVKHTPKERIKQIQAGKKLIGNHLKPIIKPTITIKTESSNKTVLQSSIILLMIFSDMKNCLRNVIVNEDTRNCKIVEYAIPLFPKLNKVENSLVSPPKKNPIVELSRIVTEKVISVCDRKLYIPSILVLIYIIPNFFFIVTAY